MWSAGIQWVTDQLRSLGTFMHRTLGAGGLRSDIAADEVCQAEMLTNHHIVTTWRHERRGRSSGAAAGEEMEGPLRAGLACRFWRYLQRQIRSCFALKFLSSNCIALYSSLSCTSIFQDSLSLEP